jgi:hypothetical protein
LENADLETKKRVLKRIRATYHRKYGTIKGRSNDIKADVEREIQLGRLRLHKERDPLESINSVFERLG